MNVDRVILNTASENPSIRTAIVAPPLIYGVSANKNAARERSAARQMVIDILKHGKGFFINEGKARWNTVHVDDLARLYLILVEQAAQGGGKATWGSESYYFAENGDVCFEELAKEISRIAWEKGQLSTDETESLTTSEGNKLFPFTTTMTLQNSRSKAVRARELFNWNPVEIGVVEDITKNWRFNAEEENPFF
jgi:nucleoside-diphosphate-sugar epimerase